MKHQVRRAALRELRKLVAQKMPDEDFNDRMSVAWQQLFHGSDTSDPDEVRAAVNAICQLLLERRKKD